MVHTRSREIVEVPIAHISVDPDFDHDQEFQKIVTQEILGKTKVALTRLHVNDIKTGFYRFESGAARHVSNLRDGDADRLIPAIQRGIRIPVEVYWNTIVPNGGGYVCPDAEAVLAAYDMLKISVVPVRIMKPRRKSRNEGAVWIEARGTRAGLFRIEAPAKRDYRAFAMSNGATANDILCELEAYCDQTCQHVVAFHRADSDLVHYHQMIHAVVRRHARLLNSIKVLLDNSRLEHAYILARSAYEGFLNFYLDWLSPEFFGPRLQLLSMIDRQQQDDTAWNALSDMIELLDSVVEKAKVSVLGERFYDAIYRPLSRATHQSYDYVEREAVDFSDWTDDYEDEERLVRCLNVLTAAIISRVNNDVGIATEL